MCLEEAAREVDRQIKAYAKHTNMPLARDISEALEIAGLKRHRKDLEAEMNFCAKQLDEGGFPHQIFVKVDAAKVKIYSDQHGRATLRVDV